MVRVASGLGVSPYITTNAILLGEKIDTLFDAGLRTATIGFYGDEHTYEPYVQRSGAYSKLERSIARVRDRLRQGCALADQLPAVPAILATSSLCAPPCASLSDTKPPCRVDIVHYSLPYFSEGPDRELPISFRRTMQALYSVVQELLEFRHRRARPVHANPTSGVRSIPDWRAQGSGRCAFPATLTG